MKTRFPREFYIPKGATKVSDKHTDAICYVKAFEHKPSGTTRYHLLGFAGKADKPAIDYSVRTMKRAEECIREFFASRKQLADFKAEQRAKRVSFVHSCKIGDIYRTCWGYDQTNVEFFEIIEIKGKFAILREIESASEGGGPGGERCVPQSGAFLKPRHQGDDRGLPIRRLIQEHGIKIDDVRTAWPWGKRVAGVLVGKPVHRTASGWGH